MHAKSIEVSMVSTVFGADTYADACNIAVDINRFKHIFKHIQPIVQNILAGIRTPSMWTHQFSIFSPETQDLPGLYTNFMTNVLEVNPLFL